MKLPILRDCEFFASLGLELALLVFSACSWWQGSSASGGSEFLKLRTIYLLHVKLCAPGVRGCGGSDVFLPRSLCGVAEDKRCSL